MTRKNTPPATPLKRVKVDPVAFTRQLTEILDRLQPIVIEYGERQQASPSSTDPFNVQPAIIRFYENSLKNPKGIVDLQVDYLKKMAELWEETRKKFLGEESHDIIRPESNDKRFRDPVWNENAVFDFIKQSYLLTSQCIQNSVRKSEGLEKHEKAKLDFFIRQFTDSIAPTNFALTNPEVLKATIDTNGQNLVKGLENLVADLERGNGELQISKTNYNAFEVGKNLAVTPGKVVFQNDLMQLLQYAPSTKTVNEVPLLIVPPWINKYYILDMRPDNSFIKWSVDQGNTVFVISWVNPDERHAKKDFYSYVDEGLLAALDQIEKITKISKTNVVGYCIGGTLLTCALGYLSAKKQQKRVNTATFLTTLIDFSNAGDLQVFIDEDQLAALDKKMSEKGFLEGSELRNTFSLLRANDLIWSYVVNNYMLGKDPFQFDLLFWNDDSTNMPAAMQSFYLRGMYKDNLLCKPNGITLNHQPIDVSKINVPSFFLSTREDHIAPWKATYEGYKIVGGEKHFVLSASGHVAGVVNPPIAKKYSFWTNPLVSENSDEWLTAADQHDGSWWPYWMNWIDKKSGRKVNARKPGKGLEDAPGSYVRISFNGTR